MYVPSQYELHVASYIYFKIHICMYIAKQTNKTKKSLILSFGVVYLTMMIVHHKGIKKIKK